MRLLLTLFLICCSANIVLAQQNTADLEVLSERVEDLEDELRRTSEDLEDEIDDEISRVRTEAGDMRDDLDSAEADLKWIQTGAAFILGVFGVLGLSLWGVFNGAIKRVEKHVKQVEGALAQKVEDRARELEDLFKKEVEKQVGEKKAAIDAMLHEGDLLHQALSQRSVLILCRDDEDRIHMKDQLKSWELSNVTYTPLDKKAEGTFDLVILDDHDKENIPDNDLKQCFTFYPDAYFLFYVNHDMDLGLIPHGVRYLFAKSHVTLKNHALNALKEIQRDKLVAKA